MASRLNQEIERLFGKAPTRVRPLGGGCVGEVYQVEIPGQIVVAKVDSGATANLETEGYMLRYLAEHSSLPVPEVLFCRDDLLVMTFIEGSSSISQPVQHHAAEILAALHAVRADAFGLERDTLIGGLHQPNPWTDSWLAFFRDQRLLYMGSEAIRAGRMPSSMLYRLEKFTERLDNWLDEPEHPSLLHGDMWTGNILASNGRVTGFVDPAIYYGHPEIELAFSTLFGTFGAAFFERYNAIRPMKPGFFEVRRDLYNLYPLLVHVRLFGGGYVGSVDGILRRVGF
jgi:fructosamine-3-kinase